MKGLLIAEKPSLMKAIQEVYKKHNPISDQLDFDCFRGHLMELINPAGYDAKYQKWKKEDLPIIPAQFIYQPIASAKSQVKTINDKIRTGGYDYIINACDAGREGELIFWSFYKTYNHKLPVKRFWASDTTDTTIKKALINLLPENEISLLNLQLSSSLRAKMDWLYGMNFSRALSIASNTTIAAGRVMTPTMKMIVQREKEILGFKAENYYEVSLKLEMSGIEFSALRLCPPDFKETRMADKNEANDIVSKLEPEVKVRRVNEEDEIIHAPTLYSLLELQKDANKYFGYTASKTLQIAQKLYEEHKLLTYPRTESRYLPKAIVPDVPKHLRVLKAVPELVPFLMKLDKVRIQSVLSTTKYVNDSKVTDHHAILNTTKEADLTKLSDEEKNIYELVAKRFLSIFLDPYIAAKTEMFLSSNKEYFRAKGKVEKQKGFSALYANKIADVVLPKVAVNDMVPVKSSAVESRQTKPPARYNDRTILDAMQNAGRTLEVQEQREILKEAAGLGTPATRAGILDKLEDRKWIYRKGKSLYASDSGVLVIDTIGERDITSAALTAVWEKKLREIEDNAYKGNFESELNDYIQKETNAIFNEISKVTGSFAGKVLEVVGICPLCGLDVVVGKSYYLCKGYKETCSLIIPKTHLKANMTEKDAKDMLLGKQTKNKRITFKDGTKAEKQFVVENGKLQFYAPEKIQKTIGVCPECSGEFSVTEKEYRCNNKDCNISFQKTYFGHVFTEQEAINLAKGETIEIYTKEGNENGKAIKMQYRKGERVRVAQEWVPEEDKKTMEIVGACPKCGSNVLSASEFFMCTGYPIDCKFAIKKTIKGASVTSDDVRKMLKGENSNVREFIWSNGKKGTAQIYLAEDQLKFKFN